MSEKFKKILIVGLILLLNLSIFPIDIAHAANASLYVTPASISQSKGSNFTVYVGVNSGGSQYDTIAGTVNLPGGIVTATSGGTGGSLCSYWAQLPTVSGTSVSFACGVGGVSTSSGNLISISLTASGVGQGSATISGARVLLNGVDQPSGSSGASFNISAGNSNAKADSGSVAAPAVTSSTHGDQNAWYKNKDVALSWQRAAGITGFSYAFDQSEGTVPATTINTNETSLNLKDKSDGVWYFHIRANGPKAWSTTTNYRVQIDTTSPTKLDIVTDPTGESGRRPVVSFNAVDTTSGIDHYDIKMDQEEFQKATSPYTPNSIKSGEHTFTVRAYDKAGNMIEDKITIKIKNVPVPKITSPKNNSTFKLIQSLDIAGTGDSSTKIDLYIDDVNIARGLTVKDDGSWSMTYKTLIPPGKHKITAVAVRDGIESSTSEIVNIQTDPSAISIFGKLISTDVLLITLFVIIGLLIGLVIWLFIVAKRNKNNSSGKYMKGYLEAQPEISSANSTIEPRIPNVPHEVHTTHNQVPPEEKIDLEG